MTGAPSGPEPAHRQLMRERLRSLLGRWLVSEDANEARVLAAALGVELRWDRVWLNPGDEERAKRAQRAPEDRTRVR